MSIDPNDREAFEKRLWAEIDKAHLGMIGIVDGEPQHFQPMTAFAEPETGRIWFYTRTETDLARDAQSGRMAMFVIQSKDREVQACIMGELRVQMDAEHRDRWWSPHVAAWYPEGKEDPRLTMLVFQCQDARVWISDAGPLKYFWEVGKANRTHKQPDIGGKADLDMRH